MRRKISESQMLAQLQEGSVLLSPLVIRHCELQPPALRADARLTLALTDQDSFRFVLESKADATPRSLQLAVAQAKKAAHPPELPMIQVPYLSDDNLAALEREQVSGVDLCGNGVIIVPDRLWIIRSGRPNLYKHSRGLRNPYSGRSALVARMFLRRKRWHSLNALREAIEAGGISISLAQTSKAVRSLQEELIVVKEGGDIVLRDPHNLLDKLGKAWISPPIQNRQGIRTPPGTGWAACLASQSLTQWAVTGESSASRYVQFWQAGPIRIAVSDLTAALAAIKGAPEPVPNFADLELIETQEPGFFWGIEADDAGVHWASRLQTWLELHAGDARQQEAARDVRLQILDRIEP